MLIDNSKQAQDDTKSLPNIHGGPFNSTLVRDELLHEIFEETAHNFPDKIALICNKTLWSYSKLDSRANQLAHYLRSQGIKKGDFVGIYMTRGLEVYVTMLAVLKAGAAYVPFDPEFPIDRIVYGLIDSNAVALISYSDLLPDTIHLPCNPILLNQLWTTIDLQSDRLLTREDTQLTPANSAYAICTSGTTGRPKCVEITHRSVCHCVRASNLVLDVNANDVFYQGFSIAFDASLEEIWLTFLVGGTLFVGTNQIVHSGAELASILTHANVTMLSCVPTLLSMLEDDIPTLRQINFAGEACPPELVKRWSKPGRRIFNTYGPTETTISATIAQVHPNEAITIGRPLPNYTTYILDENMKEVPPGEAGELHIGGIGLSKGYMNKPELTEKKFVHNPYYDPSMCNPLLYKTGDLARFNANGNIEFLGRIDTQVKLRGFRIEMAEIEAVLMEQPDIKNAVVTLHKDKQNIDRIVAYIVMREGKPFVKEKIRENSAQRLPPYMVPGVFQKIETLPLLSSGKVDRKRLPQPEITQSSDDAIVLPTNPTEQIIFSIWQTLFPEASLSIDKDFFLDLGGHSLLAAKFVSELRKLPDYRHVSMGDIYQHPSIRSLALSIQKKKPKSKTKEKKHFQVSNLCYYTCTFAQAIALYFIFGIYTFFGLMGPYLVYHWMITVHYSLSVATLAALGALVAMMPILLMIPIVAKWLVIGRYKAGEYPLWGQYYFRWWFVKHLSAILPTGYLVGNPFLSIYFRMYGAKIGKNVYLGSDLLDTFDLIEIGDDSSIGCNSLLMSTKIEDGLLKIGSISIGKNCYVGASCVIEHNTVMGDGSSLEDLSLIPVNATIPRNETWKGSPGQRIEVSPETPPLQSRPNVLKRFWYGMTQTMMIFVFPTVVMLPLFPSMEFYYIFNPTHSTSLYLLYAPIFAFIYVILFCLEIVLLKILLLGKVTPGTYSIYSGFYFRKWMFDQFMDFSLGVMHAVYGTLYLVPWYRLLGIKIGESSEVSTATTLCPDVLEIGDHSFIADGVFLGVQRVQHNQLIIKKTQIGNNTFVGNSAIIPTGTQLGNQCLVGCLSLPPDLKVGEAPYNGVSCFGSPSQLLTHRQKITDFTEEVTLKPSKSLIVQRLAFEFIRTLFPLTCYTMLFVGLLHTILALRIDYQYPFWAVALVFPVLSLLFGTCLAFITYVVKKVLIGTYEPVQVPLWSNYVWRTEFVTSVYESLLVPFFISMLFGTPYINWVLRLLGCKIGKRVYTDTTDVTEFDLVNIGDYTSLNHGLDLQTHTFEDRVMKIARIDVGKNCTIGSLSVVLFDTVMEDGSTLGSLSMLMKGETLPANTHWEGSPARPVVSAHTAESTQRQSTQEPVDKAMSDILS